MVNFAKQLTDSPRFQNLVLALILITGILSGIETYVGEGAAAQPALALAQDLILGFFVVEILLRILAHGRRPWVYFTSAWNVLDFLIVTICVLPLGAQFSAVLRMVRLLRTMRLVTILPRLQVLVGALLKSIPSLGYIGVLLGLHFYIYAVLGTFLFRENDPWRFGSLHESFLTLFQVLTLEGWNDVLGTQYLGSDIMYDDSLKAMTAGVRHSSAHPLVAAGYFVSFIMLGTMIMLNLFTGVIITSMEEVSNENAEEKRKKNLAEHGFVSLRDELALVSQKLKELSQQLEAIQAPDDPPQRV
ncbi:MAG TPA: ion transporter [Planctomycetota bacterium]|nr:ion transporter [Planctomycetota bacterium]